MSDPVIEHVRVADLPQKWREKLALADDALVTVRMEMETPSATHLTDDPAFGMWRDREDMADVANYVRRLRASRFDDDGSRRD